LADKIAQDLIAAEDDQSVDQEGHVEVIVESTNTVQVHEKYADGELDNQAAVSQQNEDVNQGAVNGAHNGTALVSVQAEPLKCVAHAAGRSYCVPETVGQVISV
jgi:hypothetical protein